MESLKKENLIVLRYAYNSCYTTLFELSDCKDVNIENNIWIYKDIAREIGKCTNIKNHLGVIGVYDRTNISHLEAMKDAAKQFTTKHIFIED